MDSSDAGLWLPLLTILLGLAACLATAGCLSFILREMLPREDNSQDDGGNADNGHNLLKFFSALSLPLVKLLSALAHMLFLMNGVTPQEKSRVTEDEVKDLIEQGTEAGTFEKTEQAMVDRIFHMSDQTIYALMTPRTQMRWLDLSDPLKHNLRLIRKTEQDVFPVGRDSLDDFCGVLYAKELLNAALAGKSLELSQYIHKPVFVPRSMETFRVLEQLKNSDTHEAMVLDEYGGVIGFVTLDDIIEEIIGDYMPGEPDPVQLTQRDEHSWLVDGLYSIDDFKERFDLDELPDEDHDHYQTMGGFLTSYFGYIPKAGEKCDWQDFTFEVVDMDRARIDKILITLNKPEDKEEAVTV